MSSPDIEGDKTKPCEYVGKVDPEVRVIYKWIIDESSIDDKKTGEMLKSPVITLSDTKHCRIELYPKGRKEDCKDYVSVFLRTVKGDFEANFTFFIFDDNENVNLRLPPANRCSFKENARKDESSIWGYDKFKENRFLRRSMQANAASDYRNALTIVCMLSFEKSILREYETRLKELDEFETLIDSEEFSDVSLDMKGEKLHAHKSILATKSPVFAAMFTHNMREREQGNVDIEDISHNIMKEFLRFIYVGKIDNLEDVAKDLFVAADKYSVVSLKSICENHLIKKIDEHNVLECLNLASLHSAPALKDRCMTYFKSNVKKVVHQSNFKLYELNKDIIDEVYAIVANRLKD